MTETRLRTLTSALAYGLGSAVFALLALQNLRYGFYGLFYPAAGLSAISLGGCAYTLSASRYQLRAKGHLPVLLLLHGLALTGALKAGASGISWSLPVLVLTYLVLPLRRATLLTLPVAALLALVLAWQLPAGESLPAIAALWLLVASAGLASWHYDHMTQSAEDLAIIDPLTGAHNARYLDETLQKEISRAKATTHPVSILMMDIDHRDQISDMLGREQMPLLYRRLAEHLFTLIRAGDTLYFLGDGRFCLILPFTPEEGARVTGERIRRSIAEAAWPHVGRMTVSMGATTHISQDSLGERLRQRATDALEEARRRGHDHVWFSADVHQVA
ncbi:GGDEF domain-containing protein [Marinobacter bryozoorum]|uniref:diguanylate cyclase domain-containing protein n=1 Tax=Marinobacter bryozoorum TaxID=256324 RepID=UPI002006C3E8|nr:GGDEF domain-containing protein [Marinobacter bryozoorum]